MYPHVQFSIQEDTSYNLQFNRYISSYGVEIWNWDHNNFPTIELDIAEKRMATK